MRRTALALALLARALGELASFTRPDDLPVDENGRLARNWLLVPRGCEQHAAELDAELRPLGVVPPDSALAEALGLDAGGDCARATCLEVGSEVGLVAEHHKRFDGGGGDGKGLARALERFVSETCNLLEVGFISYHARPLSLAWVEVTSGRRVPQGAIEPGERGIAWRVTRLGHVFEVYDDGGAFGRSEPEAAEPDAATLLLRHEVAHDGVNVLSQPPPLPADERARDRTSELAQTADFELSRANRVVRTYSPSGFAKDRVPPRVWGDMSAYYYNNRRSTVTEEWYKKGKGIYVNWYEVDAAMIFMPWDRKTKWHDALQPLVEAWANETLEKTDIYGMRVYHDGATLLQHVDREDTHALSLIINVAQSGVREPWPVHIRDHRTDEDHEVFLEPGELLFYESARCMHGRLKPLRGDFFVNLFAHYRPNGNPNWWRQPNPAPACAETAGDGTCAVPSPGRG